MLNCVSRWAWADLFTECIVTCCGIPPPRWTVLLASSSPARAFSLSKVGHWLCFHQLWQPSSVRWLLLHSRIHLHKGFVWIFSLTLSSPAMVLFFSSSGWTMPLIAFGRSVSLALHPPAMAFFLLTTHRGRLFHRLCLLLLCRIRGVALTVLESLISSSLLARASLPQFSGSALITDSFFSCHGLFTPLPVFIWWLLPIFSNVVPDIFTDSHN